MGPQNYIIYWKLFPGLGCVYQGALWHKKAWDSLERRNSGNVGGKGFEAGPFMSAVIIVRLKVGHTLWACLHKEQECSHCAGRLAGWEHYGRAELCRARHGQELPWCLTVHSTASIYIYFHYLIGMCMLIVFDSVLKVVLYRFKLRN